LADLPSGTVTFLFSDVEGSTKLLDALGSERYAEALGEHRRVVREAVTRHGGMEVDRQGDAFFFAFATPQGALAAAGQAQEALAAGPIRVRMGVHTGTPHLSDEGYVGEEVHRGARIAALGYGGQVLVSSATAVLVRDERLRDLGEYRLKDLSAPERIYQFGGGDFPPLASRHQTNLPLPSSSFLGRERELAEIGMLLVRADVRLLTLTGAGGTGKTRLALQAAGAAVADFSGGVWWVPLAPLRNPEFVLPAAVTALGATGELVEHIGDKRLLLLLDNFEHVVDAAPKLGELLRRCANLTLLVTSRTPLRLEAEWEYAVDPLRESEAVALFETRARAAGRDVTASDDIPAICERLDNLPLAIELAAARVKVLPPAALLQRLERRLPALAGGKRDVPERQRTLRATIDWSYHLLSAADQRLFALLSVFAGGSTLEAAERICAPDREVNVFEGLTSLVDKSLIRQTAEWGEPRFWMLQTIREYASERFEQTAGAEEVRRAHAEFFLEFAREAEATERGPDAPEWDRRLHRELSNIRAALSWAASAEPVLGLDLASALWQFWTNHSYLDEARGWVGQTWSDDAPVRLRLRALRLLGALAAETGDASELAAISRRRLRLARETDDPQHIAGAVTGLGIAAGLQGDLARARRLHEKAVEIARESCLPPHPFVVNVAVVALRQGDLIRARQLAEEALADARAAGDEFRVAQTMSNLGDILFAEGRPRESAALFAESLKRVRRIGSERWIPVVLVRAARLAAGIGRQRDASRLLGAADALSEAAGSRRMSAYDDFYASATDAARAAIGDAEFASLRSIGRELEEDAAVELALACLKDAS
jgi:predicted ATPase/class 3 adenylate cyclase